MDAYGILGVSRDATHDEIVAAYRKLSKKHHPDAGGRARDFIRINNAYRQVIKDFEARRHAGKSTTRPASGDSGGGSPPGTDTNTAFWEFDPDEAAVRRARSRIRKGWAGIVLLVCFLLLTGLWGYNAVTSLSSRFAKAHRTESPKDDPPQPTPTRQADEDRPQELAVQSDTGDPQVVHSPAQFASDFTPTLDSTSTPRNTDHQNTSAAATSNLAMGRELCFVQGKWEEGLPKLAAGSDPHLKALAEADLAAPTEPVAQAQIAERWWKLAEAAESRVTKTQLQLRAAYWYAKALPELRQVMKNAESAVWIADPHEIYLADIRPAEVWVVANIPFQSVVALNGVKSPHGLLGHPPGPGTSSRIVFALGKRYRRLTGHGGHE
jgi:curved DNA-binding protein CbpA